MSAHDVLTEFQAFGLLATYCFIYVLPLHIIPAARASTSRSRDDPAAIQARIRAVSLSTTACSLATFLTVTYYYSAGYAWHLLGYWPLGLLEAGQALLLTGLLFAGPLYERLIIDGAWESWLWLQPLSATWQDWPAWRNYVAGPVTEECLFRSAAVPLLLVSNASLKQVIFQSPLVFGLAHVHHFYEFRITHPRIPPLLAIANSVLQFSYTYLFGTYATFIYVRTGSLLAAIAIHTFCNSMGLPRVWGALEPYWHKKSSAPRTTIVWTLMYYVLLLAGATGWWLNLYRLSYSSNALFGF